MAVSTSNLIADDLRRHQTRIFRVSANLNAQVEARLAAIGQRMLRELLEADPTELRTYAGRQQRLTKLKKDVQAYARKAVAQIRDRVFDEAVDLAEYDSEVVAKVISKHATKNDAIPDISVVPLSRKMMRQTADRALIEGAPSSEWWSRQTDKLVRDFTDTINAGMNQGKSIADIVRDVRGTKANNYNDGIMEVSKRNAEALVRSSVLAVNNAVRLEEFKQSEVVEAVQILVTFDQRTCPICRAFSGAAFYLDSGKPLPESPYQGRMPTLPAHWKCRCLTVPLLIGEKPAEDYYYEDWLKQQSKAEQQDILGPGRWELWNKGSVSLTDMVDQRGHAMTLKQLKAEAA